MTRRHFKQRLREIAKRTGLRVFRSQQSSNGIERAIERYNSEYAFASARRVLALTGFAGAVLVPLIAAKVVFAGVCILMVLSLAAFRQPVDLACDPGCRLVPDELMGILAEPGLLDIRTREWLGAAARTHAGLPIRALRAEWLRLGPGYRALTGHPRPALGEGLPPSSDPKTTIDLHGMLQQQWHEADERKRCDERASARSTSLPSWQTSVATHNAEFILASVLLPGYTPTTLPGVVRWAEAATKRITEVVVGSQLQASVRAFRWPSPPARHSQILELSITDEHGNCHAISFTAGSKHNFHVEEPVVPDIVEAIHMVGLIARSLNVHIGIGDFEARRAVPLTEHP